MQPRSGSRRLALRLSAGEKRSNGRRDVRAASDPVAGAFPVEREHGRIADWVVRAELFEHLGARGRWRVRDHDSIMRTVAGAHAPQSDFQHDGSFLRVGRILVCGASVLPGILTPGGPAAEGATDPDRAPP